MRWLRLLLQLSLRAVVRPMLAVDLLRAGWAFRRRRWWALPPFLPLPDRTYFRWRMYTAYGNPDVLPPIDDVVRFARWRRKVMGL